MNLTPEEIDNIQARKDAAVVIELCADRGDGKQQPLHFWKCLAELAAAKCGASLTKPNISQQPPEPFTDDEAHRFERFTTLRFGKYKMQTVLQIVADDAEYIEWVATHCTFDKVLQANCQRYIATKRFRDLRG